MSEVEGPMPNITPEMIRTTFRVLEAEGMIFYSGGHAYVPTETGWKPLMKIAPIREKIRGFGDERIVATDKDSLCILKGNDIKKCTIAVRSNKSCIELGDEFRNAVKEGRCLIITITCDGVSDRVVACGSPKLSMKSEREIEIRKDEEINEGTIAILADKSASELKKDLIESIKKGSEVSITIDVI